MSAAALALPQGLSLVTIADRVPPSWASLFETVGATHIPYRARTTTERNLLAAKLDAAVTAADRSVLLVAQGASCFATAWWARLSPASYVSRVAGALFFQPVDEEETASVDNLLATFASPRTALPFPSVVLGGEAPGGDLLPPVRALADSWGSRVLLDGRGANSPLRLTVRALERFTTAVVERKLRAAEALLR